MGISRCPRPGSLSFNRFFQMADVMQSNDGFKRPAMPLSVVGMLSLYFLSFFFVGGVLSDCPLLPHLPS